MTSGQARQRLLEVAREDGRRDDRIAFGPYDRVAEERLFEAARDFVEAHRREIEDALRRKLDEVERLGE